jgi:hypothetical protein
VCVYGLGNTVEFWITRITFEKCQFASFLLWVTKTFRSYTNEGWPALIWYILLYWHSTGLAAFTIITAASAIYRAGRAMAVLLHSPKPAQYT